MTTTNRGEVARFATIWGTSVISGMGSAITTFVFGIWIYMETGSEVSFAIGMLCGTVPAIILGPFAGVIVDRFNRRWVLIITDSVSTIAVAIVAYLIWTESAEIWHFYLASMVSAAGGAIYMTAYAAMTPLLIPKRHLARANGLMQASVAAQIAAPLLAAGLLPFIGFAGVLLIDLATFSVALTALLVFRLPRRILYAERKSEPPTLWQDLTHGWRHIGERRGLRSLVLVLVGYNFFFAACGVLVQPLILSFGSASTLGVLMFVGGSGLFAGSLAMGIWGGPRRRVRGVSLFIMLSGVALVAHSLHPSAVLVGIAAFTFLFTMPIVNGASNTVFQLKVDPSSLGRVMGTVQALGRGATPIAYLLAAPLAEYIANPAMEPGGALAGSLGWLIGTGDGRGIALIILIDGLLMLSLGMLVWAVPRLRRIETDLPDMLPDEVGGPPSPPQGTTDGGSEPSDPEQSRLEPAGTGSTGTGPAPSGSAPAGPRPDPTTPVREGANAT